MLLKQTCKYEIKYCTTILSMKTSLAYVQAMMTITACQTLTVLLFFSTTKQKLKLKHIELNKDRFFTRILKKRKFFKMHQPFFIKES